MIVGECFVFCSGKNSFPESPPLDSIHATTRSGYVGLKVVAFLRASILIL